MKKILSILFILMLIITLVQIRNIYALYKDELSGGYSTSLGKWNVKVNGTDIVAPGEVVTFDMTEMNVRYENGNYVYGGSDVIAPGTEAFFDILIDTKGSDVAVRYEIEIGDTTVENGNETVGKITKYRVKDYNQNSNTVGDTANETFKELPIPMTFEVVRVEDSFGEYSIQDTDVGKIIQGSELENNFTKKNGVNDKRNIGIGVIPLDVCQSTNLSDKITVKFKWKSFDSNLTPEENEIVEELFNEFAELNNSGKIVEFEIPIKVKAIQYLGEEF